jgi:predicted nucleotide-binding protein
VREYLEKADYGIFLFTADDHLVSGEKRARPNVGLELIMAAALQMNVSMLVQKEVTLPSNLQGIVVKYFVRNKVEHIFLELRREMRDAGLDC